MKIISTKKKKDKPNDFSKKLAEKVYRGGMIITQECIFLIAYAIYSDFDATAAYLTAAIAVGQFMITIVANKYLGLAQSDHSEGGITFETAKATGFSGTQATATQNNEASI